MRKITPILMVFLVLFTTACSQAESQTLPENPTPAAILPMVSSAEGENTGASAEGQPTPAAILPMVGSAGDTNTATEGQPTPAALLPMIGSNANSAEAQRLIGDYARAVLGIEAEVQVGLGMARDLNLPLAVEDEVNTTLALSGATYFGVLTNGSALLGIGEGTLSGDTNADLQDGTLGVFSLQLRQEMPADAEAALALIQQTYPGLAALEFFAEGTESQVFAFAASQAQDYSLYDGQASLTGTLIRAGVSPSARPGLIIVWVVTASGALTTPWE